MINIEKQKINFTKITNFSMINFKSEISQKFYRNI